MNDAGVVSAAKLHGADNKFIPVLCNGRNVFRTTEAGLGCRGKVIVAILFDAGEIIDPVLLDCAGIPVAAFLNGECSTQSSAFESRYSPRAVSRKGAAGLMQLMPEMARQYGVLDSFGPVQNLHGGARYLRDLLKMFSGDISLALAAYNAGENAVLRAGYRIPPFKETKNYVQRVQAAYAEYKFGQGQAD